MSSLIASLKSEITRVARKELKGELQALRKVATAHRSEIAALKRDLKSVAAQLKAIKRNSETSAKETPAAAVLTEQGRSNFTAARFAALRSKLGLTQAEMAKVLGASSLSVHKWESGSVQPRNAQLQKIAMAAKLGKRAARAIVEQ